MLQSVDRFLKQSIVDKYQTVSSAALVSAHHLFDVNRELVKRWATEVSEVVNSRHATSQYHALGLLYLIKQHDKMALSKLVQTFTKNPLKSPLATCMLVRYAGRALEDETSYEGREALSQLLETFLRSRQELVVLEAARVICTLRSVSEKQVNLVVTSNFFGGDLMIVIRRYRSNFYPTKNSSYRIPQ